MGDIIGYCRKGSKEILTSEITRIMIKSTIDTTSINYVLANENRYYNEKELIPYDKINEVKRAEIQEQIAALSKQLKALE